MRRSDIRDNMVGNAMEALIGAIYKDHGYDVTNKAVVKLLRTHGLDQRIHETTDFKVNFIIGRKFKGRVKIFSSQRVHRIWRRSL